VCLGMLTDFNSKKISTLGIRFLKANFGRRGIGVSCK
jgi:hypothetical protein